MTIFNSFQINYIYCLLSAPIIYTLHVINLFLLPQDINNLISTNFFFPLNKLFLGNRSHSWDIFLPFFDRPYMKIRTLLGC